MAPVHVFVMYPRKATFDMKYYLATHMPLVKKHWTQYGLTKYTVTQYEDPESPYSVGCVLEFDSMDSYKKAGAGPEKDEVFGDIPNFSNEKPTLFAGEVTGTS
ncbi:uncharacterized protein N0V89_011557 [Didymosphaeria variabile]|uniref:EthD domain-containing protein n=1 Tax=Didymosphaeria variabile TaxID=1932322 RepID=A0A9W8X9Z7_9PLEO|nr:uncharacterized protein N0V89_011557 [Didymosphaeria variabile]KAJ4345427.1 hypothetical protein N0V89_011557 [Didymosphaeria variabile]